MYLLTSTQASNFVAGVDRAFVFILAVCFIFLIGLTITMIFFIFRYNRKKNPVATQIEGSNTLEMIWTIIPVILVLIMFYYGWAGWKPMKKAPEGSFEIDVIARMWNFTFKYENGRITDTLYVPMNKPVKLNLLSMDVVHSLYIPAFRVKEDVVPGREKFAWFEAQKEGVYDLFCAEYCGLQHSYMYNGIKAMPVEAFAEWYADTTRQVAADTESQVATGKRIMTNLGCFACHSTDGTKGIGPTYKGMYGHEVTVVTNGKERIVTVDDDYIKHAIYEPNADVVKGFNKGLMQSYQGQLSDDDIVMIIEYLKTLP